MRTQKSLIGALLLTGLLAGLAALPASAQEAEPPAEGCVLLETKSFGEDELGAARDYANSYSGPTGASVDGVAYVYRSTVRVVAGGMGNRVAIVKIWMCPEAKPLDAGAGGKGAGKKGADTKKPARPPVGPDVPTFDPRTHELRDGRVVKKQPQDDHSRCDTPNRFECGQHYLWWLKNHEHRESFDFGQDLENTPPTPGPPRFDFGQDLERTPASEGEPRFDFGQSLGNTSGAPNPRRFLTRQDPESAPSPPVPSPYHFDNRSVLER